MAEEPFLPELPESWEETRATLHAYALGVSIVPRSHAVAHPNWWHVGLGVTPLGLVTDPVPLPAGGALRLRMDLHSHVTAVETSNGDILEFDMTTGATATAFTDQLIEAVSTLGLPEDYERAKFESPEPRTYDANAAETYFTALTNVATVLRTHSYSLEGPVSPVNHWPHGFDTSVEWFGTRMVSAEDEEGGPAQLNFGFSPAGRPYFYSNPWPFESDRLLGEALPHGAEWHTEGWEGTVLYYDTVAGDPDAKEKLLEYAAAVHRVASPTLMA